MGPGTGYLSCIVAKVLGPTGVCYGVEINEETINHCTESVERYKEANPDEVFPHMEFIHGNGMQIDGSCGESQVGFDRIYVGSAMEERSTLIQLASLLRPGGILVGPRKCTLAAEVPFYALMQKIY